MSMMQESFSKALNPLLDKAREAEEKQTRHISSPQHHPQHNTHQQHTGKKKHPIDSYLRR